MHSAEVGASTAIVMMTMVRRIHLRLRLQRRQRRNKRHHQHHILSLQGQPRRRRLCGFAP